MANVTLNGFFNANRYLSLRLDGRANCIFLTKYLQHRPKLLAAYPHAMGCAADP